MAEVQTQTIVREAEEAVAPRGPGFARVDERGTFIEVLNEGPWHCVLTGTMKRGAVMGNHYHKQTVVYVYLIDGTAIVRTVDVESGRRDELVLTAGNGLRLPTMHSHAIRFTESSSFILLKSRPYDAQQPDTYPFPVDET